MRVRQKPCSRCNQPATVLFRVQSDLLAPWQFVCEACLLEFKAQSANYRYGGTWKAQKSR